MRGINMLWYSFKQGLKNMVHNRLFTLASISTISACLLLFGIFCFIIYNFNTTIRNVESTVGLTVFFDEDISQKGIDKIGEAISGRDEVSEIKFISADDAWEKFKKETFKGQEKELAETFGDDNPLKDSASYEVYLKDIAGQGKLTKYIKSLEGVRAVKGQKDTAKSLNNINRLIGYVSFSIVIILLLVAVFLINTTVAMGINVRKDEIAIMKYVGAGNTFICLPFVIEGLIIGSVGAAIPVLILRYMYSGIISFVTDKFAALSNILKFAPAEEMFAFITPVSLIVGIGIGLFCSFFTVRRYVRV